MSGVGDIGSDAGPGLASQVRRGAAWASASNLLLRFASIAVTALLARLLSKDDFGVFAVALAVFLVVSSLAELGMGAAVTRVANDPGRIAPTVASISIGVSAAITLVMFAGATPLARLLGQPEAAEPIRVLSLALMLTGIFAVPGAQLVREFRQDRIFASNVVSFLVANPILVLLALNGGGATSFAWSRVVGQVAGGIVMILGVHFYRPGWRPEVVGGLLRFGIPLSLANLVNFTLLNADYLIMSRLLDAAQIGTYVIAFNVANWSTALMGSVLNTVVVPAFGRVRSDAASLRDALIAAVGIVGAIALPTCAVLIALAQPIVVAVFGSRWHDAAPVLAVLAVYGALFCFTLLLVNVLVALGATGRLLMVQLAWVAALAPAMLLGLEWQGPGWSPLVGAAIAHVAVMITVAFPCYLWALRGQVRVTTRDVVATLGRPAAGAVAAGAAAAFANALLASAGAGAWPRFLVGGFAAVVVYLPIAGHALRPILPGRWQQRAARGGGRR